MADAVVEDVKKDLPVVTEGDTKKDGADGKPVAAAPAAPVVTDDGKPAAAAPAAKVGEPTPEEVKAKEEAAARAANEPPEKYVFKFADEAIKLDESLVTKFTPIAKELGLNNEKAQKLADLFLSHTTEIAASTTKSVKDQIEKWQTEFRSNPDHEKILASAKRALSVADAETKNLFESEWIGNHPKVLGFLAKLGDLLREDDLAEGSRSHGTGGVSAKEMFPSMKTE